MVKIYARILWLALAIHLTSVPFNAAAQSGRVDSTLTPAERSPEHSDAKSEFRINPNADPYRLVFPTYYDGIFRKGKIYYVGEEANRARPSVNNSFIQELNKAGQEGYRLVSATGAFPVAIGKLDEAQYEYAWFQTTGPLYAKTGFVGTYSRLSRQGFHLVDNLLVSRDCEDINLVDSVPLETCAFTDFFLLERRMSVVNGREHRLAFSGPGWRTNTEAELTTQISERMAAGFYPTTVLSKFEILVEQIDKHKLSIAQTEVKIVTSGWRDDLPKKVNALSKQKYRLALVNNGIAVMYRNHDGPTSLSYVWLNAKKKDFEKRLAQIQAQGAVYRTTYPTKQGTETELIFELGAVDDQSQREYRVLKFEFEYTENAAEKKVRKDLTPASKETIKTLNSLAKEGFVVRDLFVSDELSVLLERRQSPRKDKTL
jgi:hypothetical protein